MPRSRERGIKDRIRRRGGERKKKGTQPMYVALERN